MRGVQPLPETLKKFREEQTAAVLARHRQEDDPGAEDIEFPIAPVGVGTRRKTLTVAMELRAQVPGRPLGFESVGSSVHFVVPIPRHVIWSRTFLAIVRILVVSRYFSEFYMPIAISVLPVLLLFTGWHA